MILTIDVGNTNMVLGVYDGDDLKLTSRISSSRSATVDEFAVMIKSTLDIYGVDFKKIDGSIFSSVVPQITNRLTKALKLLCGFDPLIVGPGMKTGLNIKIDNPAQLGADMIVDSVAAIAKYPLPCIVVDMGTATTINAVNKNKEFIGTAIMPGVQISLDALSARASQLPGIAFSSPKRVIGKNTVDSMQSGIVLGNACMIDGMIERFEEELGEKCTVIATGGLSQEITAECRKKVIYDQNLLLDGLLILYKQNLGNTEDKKGRRVNK